MHGTLPPTEPNVEEAIDFLRRLRPNGPWVVTAIIPDGGTKTRTFTINDEEKLRTFIHSRNVEGHNIYYMINPVRGPVANKPSKSDIEAAEFLHVDADPDEGESADEFKARFLVILRAFSPAVSAIVNSGNGIQCLWRLAPPANDVGAIESANKALLEALGAPRGTQNIDRLFRLPGTINWPNAKKRKAGRTACLSSLIEFNETSHRLYDFPVTTTEKKTHKRSDAGSNQSGTTELPRQLASMLHVVGCGAYPSRSEALCAFIHAMLRARIDENVIIAACLDDAYRGKGIYEHVAQNGGQDCVKRQIEKALNDSPAAMTDQKRIIRYKRGDRHVVTDETERALMAAQCPVFYRGGVLVEPVWRWEKTAEKNRDALVTMLVRLNVQRLSYTTAKYAAIYHKYDGRANKWETIDPPKEVMEQLIERGHWDFPTVKGIVNSPTMRPDGSLLIEPGYDPTTQLWYKPARDLELPIIPERPTQDDARRALMLLTDLLAGFPFKDQVSKSVAVAGLLTAVLRGAFECAPLFLVLAPEPGSGKSYLVTVTGMIATGRPPPAVPMCEDKNELDKRLSAAAFEALPILHLNNLDFDLDSSLLNQMITEGVVKIRPFGKNDQTIACDCSGTTIFANGNNIRIVGDLVRRTLTTRLDTKSESPETRSFDFNPVDKVKADRGKYLASAFIIARAYMAAGSPNAETIPLAGFSSWSRVVREPLIWLGLPDPVQSMESARSLDPERGELRQRIQALSAAFGNEKEFTAAEVCQKAIETRYAGNTLAHPGLLEAFSRTDGRPLSAKSVGHQLMKHAGRVSGGLLIELAVSNDRNGHRYRIKSNGVESTEGVTEAF